MHPARTAPAAAAVGLTAAARMAARTETMLSEQLSAWSLARARREPRRVHEAARCLARPRHPSPPRPWTRARDRCNCRRLARAPRRRALPETHRQHCLLVNSIKRSPRYSRAGVLRTGALSGSRTTSASPAAQRADERTEPGVASTRYASSHYLECSAPARCLIVIASRDSY